MCLHAKFGAKTKILKFGTKNALFAGILGLEFEKNIVLFKSVLWNLYNGKSLWNIENV